ncbi:DUF4136 domain-containing protein [Acidobacteriota bacterium]
MKVDTNHWGYGYGPRWGWNPYWGGDWRTSTTTVREYERGTLLIDIWDVKTKHLIWRGSAEATIPSNSQKQAKQIDNALKKIVKKWQKMYKKEVGDN